jgi:hypothetical protein
VTRQIFCLKKPEVIHSTDPSGLEYFGCDQNWYLSSWQQISGCGPTTASTLLLYECKSGRIRLPLEVLSREDCVRLMEAVWAYVTPTPNGIYLSEQFCDGMMSFAASHGFELDCHALNVIENRMERPSFSEVLAFIQNGLIMDRPIAFLNLSNGDLDNLEEWHWVTLVALETDSDTQAAYATIFDGDKSETIDLKQWYEQTVEGGSMVYLVVRQNQPAE